MEDEKVNESIELAYENWLDEPLPKLVLNNLSQEIDGKTYVPKDIIQCVFSARFQAGMAMTLGRITSIMVNTVKERLKEKGEKNA